MQMKRCLPHKFQAFLIPRVSIIAPYQKAATIDDDKGGAKRGGCAQGGYVGEGKELIAMRCMVLVFRLCNPSHAVEIAICAMLMLLLLLLLLGLVRYGANTYARGEE
ncbi:uncharacterized protein H6S33_003438 [Morchella sextelata]|uniref:uncharacterized protein n=1 Tax=Morchella sextelata TaxID=1174677 RepID=UPI001D038743|nr:uncharacterized protein H6S33_003438 [Morchella sextelata]KAH0606604.1 hypothetical protein H6S33_003438 [Morchella sextelata]